MVSQEGWDAYLKKNCLLAGSREVQDSFADIELNALLWVGKIHLHLELEELDRGVWGPCEDLGLEGQIVQDVVPSDCQLAHP